VIQTLIDCSIRPTSMATVGPSWSGMHLAQIAAEHASFSTMRRSLTRE
jgi:hypothetical protein